MSKELGVGKDGYQKGGVKIKVPSQNMKVDPRAATVVEAPAKDYLATGDKPKVRGTRRMLSTKNKIATWY